jgi:hypothetical protein
MHLEYDEWYQSELLHYQTNLRASTLVWSDRLSYVFTCNLGSTQQTTYAMICLVSRLMDLYDSLICAHKTDYYELHGNNNSYNGCGVVS